MIGSVRARRTVGLLVLALAALLVLSAALGAEADAKKKKKINVVQCQPNSETANDCFGTEGRDRLVGTNLDEEIKGQEGNDIYQGNSGDDVLFDSSLTSSDIYTGYEPDFTGFGNDEILDNGGSSDFLDLSSLRMLDDVALVREGDNLFLNGPAINDVRIVDHFGTGRIEKIKFANATVTGTQAQSIARGATEEGQAVIEKRAAQDEKHATEIPEKE